MKKESIAAIKEQLNDEQKLSPDRLARLKQDPRAGVRRLLEIWERRRARERRLKAKFREMNLFEDTLQSMGYQAIGGIDEAGRGPLAGPVVAACVLLRPGTMIPGINDSKQLTPLNRKGLFEQIKVQAVAFGIGVASAQEIDAINIYQAAKRAMMRAVDALSVKPDYLLIDAMELPSDLPQKSLIKGDARSNSIAAASIMAKVTRDRMMEALDKTYPGYGFAVHKGYGTPAHLQAIDKLGPCPEHRMSFAPLKS